MKRQDLPPDGSGFGDEPSASRHRRGEVGFDRWLKAKLHDAYDSVLEEKVPDDLMQLLEAFETAPRNGAVPRMTSPDDDKDVDEDHVNGRPVIKKDGSDL